MPNYLSTISAPDANLAAADMTSNFHNFEAAMLNVVMNNQPGMMYWNGGDGDDDKVNWLNSSPTQKIEHLINSIRDANQNDNQFLTLAEMFSNFPNLTTKHTTGATIDIDGHKMFIKMSMATYKNLTVDLYSYKAWIPIYNLPEVTSNKITYPAGSYDYIRFNAVGQEKMVLMFGVQVESGKNNTDIFDNYIFGN